MNSNSYPDEKRKAECGSSLLCLDALEEFSQNLDLSSLSETFSCESDTDESIIKEEDFNSEKKTGNAAGEEKTSAVRDDEPNKGSQELIPAGTVNSQMQQQHDNVTKQLNHVKALMQANQLLTEGLRNKLLQIWCHVPKNEVGSFQDDEISEVDTESLLVLPGEESSVASVYEDDQNVQQQSNLLKAAVENAQREGTSGCAEIHHSANDVSCLHDFVENVKPQGSMCLGERVPDRRENSEKQNGVLRDQATSPTYDCSELELVGTSALQKVQLTISLKNLENATKEMQEYNQKIMLAKNVIEDTAETVKSRLQKIQCQLMELEAANQNLHLQIGKLNADYSQMQEHHRCVVCENKNLEKQCVDLQTNLNSTSEENEHMLTVIDKLEKKMEAALMDLTEIKMEKDKLEQQVQSLKDEYNSQEEARIVEREQINRNYSQLVDEIELLRVQSEKEHLDTQNLQQEISAVRNENHRLQQVAEEEIKKKKLVELDARRWKKANHKLTVEQQEKERQTNIVMQTLKTEMNALKDTSKKREKEIKQSMKMLANIILDMKLVHSDLSTKGPSDKGDCANSVCVRRTSQILSKIDVILSSMEGIIISRESNSSSNGVPPDGIINDKALSDLKEKLPAASNKSKHSKQEECAAIDPKVRESSGNSTSSLKNSKNETVQKRITKKNEECKMLAAENVKLHKCVKELTCKVNGFNKIIQFADQRLQMNNLHILRLEKKNSILLAALNKRPRKNESRGSSPDSTSGSSNASGRACHSKAKQFNHDEADLCFAKGTLQHLKMGNKRNQKPEVDHLESKEYVSSQYQIGSSSQLDIYSVCNKKDEHYLETETVGTASEISQDDVDVNCDGEKDGTNCNASYYDSSIAKSVPKEDILDKEATIGIEDEDVNAHKPNPGEDNKYTEDYCQTKAVTLCNQKQDKAVKLKYNQGKSSDEFNLLATENIRLHTYVNDLQYKELQFLN
ncbi:uncharacterized protein PFB0145c-like isoform X1 [Chiloscyllium plagiosum]|uniref:uncharacterized protein PFB0145c-like isoform X1 n=2 Tax=Chiloscyllium plagiosum TaxID=36176 RepID=UPI001CB7CAE8|nr:uncharacterized protein PFB0145c-like isoform X1 [Chiloscyllium plagiosum]